MVPLGQLYGALREDIEHTLQPQDYVSLLNTSYRDEDPRDILHALLANHANITLLDILWLVEHIDWFPYIVHQEGITSPLEITQKDIDQLYDWTQDILDNQLHPSPEAMVCHFVHFATSLIHMWGTFPNETTFCLALQYPIICYIDSGQPCSYIWFNVDHRTGELQLKKHNLYLDDFGDEKPFRCMVHRTWSPGKMDKVRFSYDLTTRRTMQTARNSAGMLQISVRLDKNCPADKRVYVTMGMRKWGNFCIVLTFGPEQHLKYVGYNCEMPDKDTVVVHPCIAALHQLDVL